MQQDNRPLKKIKRKKKEKNQRKEAKKEKKKEKLEKARKKENENGCTTLNEKNFSDSTFCGSYWTY